ncbi:hypothetical protein FR483_n004R [Paramecium bursaria Chlorella virus FR483]|uniref:Uncharacterized protein n004R n=1 Tax=Paramecium bursaria Chlorella virus FR483 TaxID=399781 RepID=A7J658_PBCVF|nr:hypothetical protein FR483_n004R [Paramecium bursaria Chlorella virus FR483]ABT15289.1 hypothetical protein FR483_n004R [Paramecium bursaria Chlorella virus FR483]
MPVGIFSIRSLLAASIVVFFIPDRSSEAAARNTFLSLVLSREYPTCSKQLASIFFAFLLEGSAYTSLLRISIASLYWPLS